MRSKIRPHNMTAEFRDTLDREARAYFDARVNEYAHRLQGCFAKRWMAATMLAANDQHDFGADRGKNLIDGIIEIISGNCDDMYSKNEIDKPGTDKAYCNMIRELEDRGIYMHVTIIGANVRAEIKKIKRKNKIERETP